MENEEKNMSNKKDEAIELVDKINEEASSEHDLMDLEFTATNVAIKFDSSKIANKSHEASITESNILPINQSIGANAHSLSKAEIRAQVAEAKTEIVATFAAEAKVLEHQMNQIIKQMYAKNPEMKPLLLKMKKLLADHSDIKRISSVDPLKKSA